MPCGKYACNACGNQPPERVSCPGKAKPGKSGGKGNGAGHGIKADAAVAGKGKGGRGGKWAMQSESLAAKQVKEMAEARKQEAAKFRQQIAEERKAREAAEAMVEAAKAGGFAADKAGNPAVAGSGTKGGSKDSLQADLKELRERISKFRDMDEQLREYIVGGYEASLAELEGKKDALLALQRGGLPLKAQLAKSQSFVDSNVKRLEADRRKDEQLAAQLAEITEKVAEQAAVTAATVARPDSSKAELADISAKVAAENGKPATGAQLLPSVAATGAEVALLLDALKLVPANATSALGATHDDVVARMQAFIAKMEAQALAPDVLQQQIVDMQKREAENVEALKKIEEQMDQDGDSDAESEAPSQAGGEEARKKKRRER